MTIEEEGRRPSDLDVPRDNFPCRTAAAGRFEDTFHFHVTPTQLIDWTV